MATYTDEDVKSEVKNPNPSRSFYAHCNQLTVNVDYSKKKQPIPGNIETIHAITACLNSQAGGLITLKNDITGRGKECEAFDVGLDDHFGNIKLNQTNNYEIWGSYRQTERLVFVKTVQQKKLLFRSHAFQRENTRTVEVHKTEDLLKILGRENILWNPSKLPTHCCYNEFFDKDTLSEGRMIEFKELDTADNIFKHRDRYLTKYVSCFACSSGGRMVYGIEDETSTVVGMPIEDKVQFRKKIDEEISKMYWYKAGVGCIRPEEGKHWMLDFMDIKGEQKTHRQKSTKQKAKGQKAKGRKRIEQKLEGQETKRRKPEEHRENEGQVEAKGQKSKEQKTTGQTEDGQETERQNPEGCKKDEGQMGAEGQKIKEPKYVAVLTIFPLAGGIVFTTKPECPILDASCQTGYRMMETEEWWKYLTKLYDMSKQDTVVGDYEDWLKRRFQKLELNDPTKDVLAVKGHHPCRLREKCLPTVKGKYTLWSDTPKQPAFLEELQASCGKDEQGVIVVTELSHLKNFPDRPPEASIFCDVILLSNKKGVHLITVLDGSCNDTCEKYCKEVGETLDRNLKGYFANGHVEQFVLIQHIMQNQSTLADVLTPEWTEFGFPNQLDNILESLILILNTFASPFSQFSQCTGVEVLNLFTEDQCNLVWNKMNTHKRLFVHGLAGTGKTLMAMTLVNRLSNIHGPETVLYICVSKALRNEVRKSVPFETNILTQAEFETLYKKTYCDNSEGSCSVGSILHLVKHVVFDEAQNIEKNTGAGSFDWYDAGLDIIKRNGRQPWNLGYLWVFCDMSQKSHLKQSGVPSVSSQTDIYILTHVVRNPRRVFNIAHESLLKKTPVAWEGWQQMYEEDVIPRTDVMHQVEGVVTVVHYNRQMGVSGKLDKIANLLSEHKHSGHEAEYKDIAVLTNTREEAEVLQIHLKEFGIPVTFCDVDGAMIGQSLIVDSVLQFSGLEKPIVIVVDISPTGEDHVNVPQLPIGWRKANKAGDNWRGLNMQAFTRAMYRLFIIQKKVAEVKHICIEKGRPKVKSIPSLGFLSFSGSVETKK